MIRIDRYRLARPSVFDSEPLQVEFDRLTARHTSSEMTKQVRFKSKSSGTLDFKADVRPVLSELSHWKCAYCESLLPTEDSGRTVDRFRPESNALDLARNASEEHYWWLKYTWENLVPACTSCTSLKGTNFPVTGPRLPVPDPVLFPTERFTDASYPTDENLIVDPFLDLPHEHFKFGRDGRVAALSEAGATTINLLGLERATLNEQRREAIDEVESTWDSALTGPGAAWGAKSNGTFERLLDPANAHVGARRSWCAQRVIATRRAGARSKDAGARGSHF